MVARRDGVAAKFAGRIGEQQPNANTGREKEMDNIFGVNLLHIPSSSIPNLNLTQRATTYLHPPSPQNHHNHHHHHQHIRKVLACIMNDALAVPLILVEELFLQQQLLGL